MKEVAKAETVLVILDTAEITIVIVGGTGKGGVLL